MGLHVYMGLLMLVICGGVLFGLNALICTLYGRFEGLVLIACNRVRLPAFAVGLV